MGQYYSTVTKDVNGKETVYNQQIKFTSENRNFDYYNGVKLMEHSWWGNDFCNFIGNQLLNEKLHVAWIGDYAEPEEIKKAGFSFKKEGINGVEVDFNLDSVKYLINHTKKVYVDLADYKKKSMTKDGWCIFPISLLTAIGNGRGGGDYHETYPNYELCGTWAGDLISLSNEVPNGFEVEEVYFKECQNKAR